MKIAVIIPVYNMKDSIKECLTALMEQKRKADCVILVDNNSSDGTHEYAKGLIAKNGWNIELLKENKRGPSAVRNRALKNLQSDIDVVAFTDSDCIPRGDWLQNIEKFFLQNENAAGVGGIVLGYKPKSLVQKFITVQRYYLESKRLSGWVSNKKSILGGLLVATNNGAFRRSLLEAIGDFKEEIHIAEDIDISLRILEKGHLIYVANNDIVVFHKDVFYFLDYIRKIFNYKAAEILVIKNHFKNKIMIKIPCLDTIVFENSPYTALIDLKFIAAFMFFIIGLKFYFILIAFFAIYILAMGLKLVRVMSRPEINITKKYCIIFSLLFILTKMLGAIGRIRGAIRHGIVAM